jgi:HEAT repeat protein
MKYSIYHFLPVLFLMVVAPIGTIEISRSQPVSQLSSERNAEITKLIKDLQTGNEERAFSSLERMKADAKSIVPQLLPLLAHPNPNVRRSAIRALTIMEDTTKSTISAIVTLLKDADPIVRINAIFVLGKNGMSSADNRRFELGERANELEPAIASLIPFLKTANAETRRQLTLAIGEMEGGAKSTVPQLIALLDDPNPDVRLSATYLLPRVGGIRGNTAAKSAIPKLVLMIKDPDPTVSLSAATAVAGMATLAEDAIPQLVKFLKDPNPLVRSHTAYALGLMGYSAKSAVPQLTISLKDRDASVRAQVVEALGRIGSSAASALPQLTLRLKDADPLVRRKTVLALGQMGEAAKSAIPSLVPLLKDPNLKGDVKSLLDRLGYKSKS